jgi:hypothetical protein
MILNKGSIPPRQRELVILRMGWNCQSRYEFGQHTLMARAVGLTDDEILHLTRPPDMWPWSADDRVSEQTWLELTAHFSDSTILEYMAATLFYRAISGVLNSCGVELDEGVPGWPV